MLSDDLPELEKLARSKPARSLELRSTDCSRARQGFRMESLGRLSVLRGLRWVALGIGLSSAVAAEPIRRPVRSLLEMRQEGVIVQKWETSCAAAALANLPIREAPMRRLEARAA